MRLTIVYDNEVDRDGLQADWGFSCLVEEENQRLLFDTGAKGVVLLDNMTQLDIDPQSLTHIFISHAHWDHTGGLKDLLRLNRQAQVYIPASYLEVPEPGRAVKIQEPGPIVGNFFSTGELPGAEQSLVVKSKENLTVICGCSHPGVGAILKAAAQFGQVSALVGGLHGFKEFELLKGLPLVCACHCTQHIPEILKRYPKTAIKGGAGKVLLID